MDPFIAVLVIIVCLVASAFFSGSETALLRLRAHEIEEDVREARGPAAVAVRDLLASTSRLLVTILLGNNLVNILGSATASGLAIYYLGSRDGILVATVVMTILLLVSSEIIPKALAAAHPRRISYAVALPLYLFHAALWPLHRLFDRVIEPLVLRIGGSEGGESPTTAEEVLRMAREAHSGRHEGEPLVIMGAAAGAAEMTVEEIMVERTQIVAFPIDIPPKQLLEGVLAEGYTRVPLYEDTIDQIHGTVHRKDLVKLCGENGNADLLSILKPILRVPERKKILILLADMQRVFVHVAIVKDEFGVTMGMVTQEDILEEIVGEIRDEFDRDELLTIRVLPDGSHQALGRIKGLDFNRETGSDVPAEKGDTLSGLVFNELGRAPRKGDIVRVPGYEFGVADVSGTRITRLRVKRCAKSAEATETS